MKKFILIVLSIIVLLVGVFFAVGIVMPSYQYTTRVEVNRTADVAWDYFADETKIKEWMTGLKSIELISGEKHKPGAKFKMEFDEDGRQITMTETVTEYVPRERFSFTLENEVINSQTTVKFTERDGRTTIEQTVDVRGGNPFWRSLFALMKSTFESNSQEILNTLKSNIERQ
jgi:uncharacterized membrane protein